MRLERGDVVRVGNGSCWWMERHRDGNRFEARCLIASGTTQRPYDTISVFSTEFRDRTWITDVVPGATDYDQALAIATLLMSERSK